MNPLTHFKEILILPLLIPLVFVCVVLLPSAQAIPEPDLLEEGGPGYNTALGTLTLSINTGIYNTALGAGTLFTNTTGGSNTAVGLNALRLNTTGYGNTAVGRNALYDNTSGGSHTAVGFSALKNTIASGDFTGNTAVGTFALFSDTTGNGNVAVGWGAGLSLTTGFYNTATGYNALASNTTGYGNTAIGRHALWRNTTGVNNTALGTTAGYNQTAGTNNIYIGSAGVDGESSTIRIGAYSHDRTFIESIRGVTTGNADAIPVLIDSLGQLGTLSSSRRFKKEIEPMEKASEAILALNPVTFHYRSDKTNTAQFGLIAEEVAEVNPDLVVRDENGEIYTVRYDQVNAMLLNEFLKEHKRVQGLEATVAQQKKGMELLAAQLKEQAAQIRKVSAGVDMSKFATERIRGGELAPKMVLNNP
jgi:hypothetical protein